MLPAQSWLQGLQGAAGSGWQCPGRSRAWGARRRETQGHIAMRERGPAEQRERVPLGCPQEGGDEGKPRESCQPTSRTLGACAGWVGVRRAWLDTPAAEPARARPCPAALPGPALSGLPGHRDRRQRSASAGRDAAVKGGVPAAGAWESSSGQGQVTGASLQRRRKRGHHLTKGPRL